MSSNIDPTVPIYKNPTTESVRDNFAAAKAEIEALQGSTEGAPFLPISGGALQGSLILAGDPVAPLESATRNYVDNAVASGGAGGGGGVPEAPLDTFTYGRADAFWVEVLPLAGGSLTGDLGIPGNLNVGNITATGTVVLGQDPAAAMQAVTRQYADTLGVPLGGAPGQVLAKNSATDRDYSWGSAVGLVIGNPAGAALGGGQLNIQNLLVVNNNASALPITNASATRLAQFIGGDAVSARVIIDSFGTGVVSTLAPRSARGTGAAPAALQAGDGLGFFGFNGYGTSGFSLAANISVYAAENFSAAHQGSMIHFNVTPVGSALIATNSMTIGGNGGGVQIGSPSVGDPGAGSLAVAGVLWNNSIAGGTSGNINIGTGSTGNLANLNFYANQVTVQGGNLAVANGLTVGSDITLGGTLRGSGSSLAIGGTSGNIGTLTLYANNTNTQSNLTVNGVMTATGDVVAGNGWVTTSQSQLNIAHTGGSALTTIYHDANDTTHQNDGHFNGWVYSPNFVTTSDRAIKRDIRDVPGCLQIVLAVAPHIYDLDRIPDERGDEGLAHWGFIADEVEVAMADAGCQFGGLVRDYNTGLQGLAYHELTAVLWAAVRELSLEVEQLKRGRSGERKS